MVLKFVVLMMEIKFYGNKILNDYSSTVIAL